MKNIALLITFFLLYGICTAQQTDTVPCYNPIIDAFLQNMTAGAPQNVVAGTQTDDNLVLSKTNSVQVDNNTVFLPNGVDCGNGCEIALAGPWVSRQTDSTFTINPPYELEHDTTVTYTFFVTDVNGCVYDTPLVVNVYANKYVDIYDTVVSDSLPYIWNGLNFVGVGSQTFETITTHEADSFVTMHLSVIYEYDTTVCSENIPIQWLGDIYYAGTVVKSIPKDGADSIIIMTLTVRENPDVQISGINFICNGQSGLLTASEATSYLWSTGDTLQSITVGEPGIYTVKITGANGCSGTASRNITKSYIKPIDKINIHDICAGDNLVVTVGHDTTNTIVIANVETSIVHTETVFLPDGRNCGSGCSYKSPVTFTHFEENATVQSVDDIHFVRLNMEHSYAGDLYINITCPNGQKADILKYSNYANYEQSSNCSSQIPASSRNWQSGSNEMAGTYFGNAYDFTGSYNNWEYCNKNLPKNAPGEGWNYCWSNNSTENFQYAQGAGSLIYRSGNAHSHSVLAGYGFWGNPIYTTVYIFDSSNVAAGTQFYHPDQSFASLVGCPLNGSWYIEVLDGWSGDNGYIFEWELALAPHLVPVEYHDVTHTTVDGPWVTTVNDSMFVIAPPVNLPKDTTVKYTFHCFDDFGCSNDTVVKVTFFARDSVFSEITECDSYSWHSVTYNESGVYNKHLTNVHGCDSLLVLNLTINKSKVSQDSLFLVQNQIPYYFASSDTVFGANSPLQFQFSYKLQTQNGCDSTILQKVVIYQNTAQTYDTTACAADFPLTWQGHTFLDAGTFYDSVLNTNGSTNYLTYNILKDTLDLLNTTITHISCYGDSDGSATVTVSGGIGTLLFEWKNVNDSIISSSNQINNVVAGTYSFTITDQEGCKVANTVTINNLNGIIQPGSISPDQNICIGNALQPFTGDVVLTAGQYQWQISTDGTVWTAAPGGATNQNYIYPSNLQVGSFMLRRAWISNGCGIYYSDTVTVNVFPEIFDTVYAVVCQNSEYQMFGFNISANQTQNLGVQVFSNGPYQTLSCDSTCTLVLNVNPVFVKNVEDDICDGDGYSGNGFSIPKSKTSGINTYHDSLNLQTISGCDSIICLKLNIIDTSLKLINHTPDFCEDLNAVLSVETNMSSFVWNNGQNAEVITIYEPGVYSVEASQGDCSNRKSVVITPCPFDMGLLLPNAITPTKPGNNDCFHIPEFFLDQINEIEITIYNRLGNPVFYSEDKYFRWFGEINGKIAVNNVFNYVIRYKNQFGKYEFVKGSITVL